MHLKCIISFNKIFNLLFILLEQEMLNNPIPSEVPTDNGVAKEFDPLRSSKEERSKTPQTSQQIKSKLDYI